MYNFNCKMAGYLLDGYFIVGNHVIINPSKYYEKWYNEECNIVPITGMFKEILNPYTTVIDIIMTSDDLTTAVFDFISSLCGKARKCVIHSFIRIADKPMNVNHLRNMCIGLLPFYATNPKSEAKYAWLRFEKGFQPIKISNFMSPWNVLGGTEVWLNTVSYGNRVYPTFTYQKCKKDSYNEYHCIQHQGDNILLANERIIRPFAIYEFKMMNSKMLDAFKSDDEIWKYMTHQGEWATLAVQETNNTSNNFDINQNEQDGTSVGKMLETWVEGVATPGIPLEDIDTIKYIIRDMYSNANNINDISDPNPDTIYLLPADDNENLNIFIYHKAAGWINIGSCPITDNDDSENE